MKVTQGIVDGRRIREGLRAGAVAALVSGIPSTVYSVARRRDPLEATIAAGSMLLRHETRRVYLVAAAIPIHFALSGFWGIVLAQFLPRKRPLASGTIAGLGIGVLDLLVVGRRFPRIRALPTAPQLADHVAFGVTVAFLLRATANEGELPTFEPATGSTDPTNRRRTTFR